MSRERVRVVVIGGGVVGCAVLHELVRQGVDGAVLVEAEQDVGEGASKSNSAIVHTGFDAKAGTIEAELLRRASRLWPAFVRDLSVPFLEVGAVMLARSDEEVERLRSGVIPAAEAQGVATELLSREALRERAPYVTPAALAAVSIPGESIIDPFWLTRAYAEAAIAGGAEVRLGSAVTGLDVSAERALVARADGSELEADLVFDCAGLRADEIAAFAGDVSFDITPRKGQLLVSEETFGVESIVLPLPGPVTKGMLVTPIVFGGVLMGPTAVDQADKDDRSTDPAETARIRADCEALVPALAGATPVREFAGLRTVSSTGDYIIRPSGIGPRLWIVGGIRSTGVSASPAIAERAVSDAMAHWRWPVPAAPRPLEPLPTSFPDEAGEVVCLCRGISRGEVEAACDRALAPRTIDGLKRRGGATFGHCQGSLCSVEVATILAERRGVPISAVEQSRAGSWLFAEEAGTAATGVGTPSTPAADRAASADPSSVDVVVIGGGRSGRAAAREVEASGRVVVVLEHRDGSTVIDMQPDDGGWHVTAQRPDGYAELDGRAVIIATGGYVEPRGSRPIAGPRPSGVITADLAERALDAGLLPGRAAVVVGPGAGAAALVDRLSDAGVTIVGRLDEQPSEIRGARRLEAVRSRGGWIACDTLVLADRRLPQTFLLGALGLVDEGPGRPAPADTDGRLPQPGLWAAGCCVRADADHQDCAAAGARVGRHVAAALGSVDR